MKVIDFVYSIAGKDTLARLDKMEEALCSLYQKMDDYEEFETRIIYYGGLSNSELEDLYKIEEKFKINLLGHLYITNILPPKIIDGVKFAFFIVMRSSQNNTAQELLLKFIEPNQKQNDETIK